MDDSTRSDRRRGASVAVLILALLVLASPLRLAWAQAGVPWWVLLALWAGVVLLAACVARLGSDQGG